MNYFASHEIPDKAAPTSLSWNDFPKPFTRARIASVSRSQWKSSSYFTVAVYINELFAESDSEKIHSTLETVVRIFSHDAADIDLIDDFFTEEKQSRR